MKQKITKKPNISLNEKHKPQKFNHPTLSSKTKMKTTDLSKVHLCKTILKYPSNIHQHQTTSNSKITAMI
jgi:hypothetical protein